MYANDTQVYGLCRLTAVTTLTVNVTDCVEAATSWMQTIRLQPNPDDWNPVIPVVHNLSATASATDIATADRRLVYHSSPVCSQSRHLHRLQLVDADTRLTYCVAMLHCIISQLCQLVALCRRPHFRCLLLHWCTPSCDVTLIHLGDLPGRWTLPMSTASWWYHPSNCSTVSSRAFAVSAPHIYFQFHISSFNCGALLLTTVLLRTRPHSRGIASPRGWTETKWTIGRQSSGGNHESPQWTCRSTSYSDLYRIDRRAVDAVTARLWLSTCTHNQSLLPFQQWHPQCRCWTAAAAVMLAAAFDR